MYKKNTLNDRFSRDPSGQNSYYNNHVNNTQNTIQPHNLFKELQTDLHLQIYSLPYCDDHAKVQIISMFDSHFECSRQIPTKRPYYNKFIYSKDDQKIIIFSGPMAVNSYQLVVELRRSARFITHRIKGMLPLDPAETFEFSEKYRKCLKVKTSKNLQEVLSTFTLRLKQDGYQLTGDTKNRNNFYHENREWTGEHFRLTLRTNPSWRKMPPALLQIDRFIPTRTSYIKLFRLLTTIEVLNVTINIHKLEVQTVFPHAHRAIIQELLQRIALKNVQTFGYMNSKGDTMKMYSTKTTVSVVLHSTNYLGNSRSSIQIRIYKKPHKDPKMEFILRRSFLKKTKLLTLADLSCSDIWGLLAPKVVFGTLKTKLPKTKNKREFVKARKRSQISLQWSRQGLPNNAYRYIEVDKEFVGRVSESFAKFSKLLHHTIKQVEGENLNNNFSSFLDAVADAVQDLSKPRIFSDSK